MSRWKRLRKVIALDYQPEPWEPGHCFECKVPVAGYQGVRTKLGLFCSRDHAENAEIWKNGW